MIHHSLQNNGNDDKIPDDNVSPEKKYFEIGDTPSEAKTIHKTSKEKLLLVPEKDSLPMWQNSVLL